MYYNMLHISSTTIALMSEENLTNLMGQLFRAQAHLCGSPQNEIRINTESNAKDGGCDGWTGRPKTQDDWLGSSDTCWQFKKGTAGQPARLAGEITKDIPRETLNNGGRFVLIANGSTNGKSGERSRLKKLKDDAKSAGIPQDKIEVIGSDRLAIWCNQHPAIAAHWAGRPEGLWTFDDWSSSDEHQVPWQASEAKESEISDLQVKLDLNTGEVLHIHIQGPPGVGKTRFALELCRTASWREFVIYVRQSDDARLTALIDSVASYGHAYLMVVADEVQDMQLRPLRDSIGRSNGRIRLITIGHCDTPDMTRIPSKTIRPLENDSMREIVRGWRPSLPFEHVDFIVRFADGYVRLARLATDAVTSHPAMDVSGLLGRSDIRVFLDKLIGSGNRRPLYVVAALTHVGWTQDKEEEGKAIAGHFGLGWNDVRDTVDDFQRRLGIVPRGGRYRYISPTPLGIYLAMEAWTTYPDIMKDLPDVLPSEPALDAYYERLQTMTSNPQAREYAREELNSFFLIDDFLDGKAVRRWAAFSSADPDRAASNLLRAISHESVENRARIQGRARRELVSTLVHLAWRSSSFHDAVKALALLAEAENETWANNATNEFTARFLIDLGGTAVPYMERLPVLDELLAEERPALTRLVVKALAQASNLRPMRIHYPLSIDELPENEWHPQVEEHLHCIESAINRLCTLAGRGIADLQDIFVETAKDFSNVLHNPPLMQFAANFFDAVRKAYPTTRESLRKTIAKVIHFERTRWKKLPAGRIHMLEELHARFEDSSLGARLQQHVGQPFCGQEDKPDMKPLAAELLSDLKVLEEYWPWLTSGEAFGAWVLGEALGELDMDCLLAEVLPSLQNPGRDFRLVCAYVQVRRNIQGDEWYDSWMTTQYHKEPKPITMLLEVSWSCGITDRTLDVLINVLKSEKVSAQDIGRFEFGSWMESLKFDRLEMLIQAMVENGHNKTAVSIVAQRMASRADEYERWVPVARVLATDKELIQSYDASYHWKEIAKALVSHYSREITQAIFSAQADKEVEGWFLEHNLALEVLYACIDHDAQEVWDELMPYLSSDENVYSFCIGFPRGVLELMPADDVKTWIEGNPERNASIAAGLVSKDFSSDATLASRIIGTYGNIKNIGNAFLGEYISGSYTGPSSLHWTEMAITLEEVSQRTALPKLRHWATNSARLMRDKAQQDLEREREEQFRWR